MILQTKKTYKAILLIGLIVILAITASCLAGCSGEKEQTYSVGETVETDTAVLTLDRAELAIALENSGAATVGYGADGLAKDDYFMPTEYDPADKNPFVAQKGHTLVSMTFTIENLDRTSLNLGEINHFVSFEYDGETYSYQDTQGEYGVENKNDEGWKNYTSNNAFISAGDTCSYKCYLDVPVEIEDFNSPFEVTFHLRNSDEESVSFTYAIN